MPEAWDDEYASTGTTVAPEWVDNTGEYQDYVVSHEDAEWFAEEGYHPDWDFCRMDMCADGDECCFNYSWDDEMWCHDGYIVMRMEWEDHDCDWYNPEEGGSMKYHCCSPDAWQILYHNGELDGFVSGTDGHATATDDWEEDWYHDGDLGEDEEGNKLGQRTCFKLFYETYREQETYQEVRTLKGEQVTCTTEDMHQDVKGAELYDETTYCPFTDRTCRPYIDFSPENDNGQEYLDEMTAKYCEFSGVLADESTNWDWEWDQYMEEKGVPWNYETGTWKYDPTNPTTYPEVDMDHYEN